MLNISRAECCAACVNATKCVAWAWGRDNANPEHRHNCYMCAGLKGTRYSVKVCLFALNCLPSTVCPQLKGTRYSDQRDFGCVERSAGDNAAGRPAPAVSAPPAGRRTNYSYFATAGTFASTPDETIVGLGQVCLFALNCLPSTVCPQLMRPLWVWGSAR